MPFVRLVSSAIVAFLIGADPAPADDVFPLANEPALRALLAEGLEKSPELRGAREAARAAEARVPQAGALADPTITIGYENGGHGLALGADDDTGLGVAVRQDLPFPGKRRLTTALEEKDAQVVRHQVHRAQLELTYGVRLGYAGLLLARENLALIADQERATRDIEELTRSRYAVGLAGQSDVLRAQAELARLQQMRLHEQGEETTAVAELNRLLARPTGAPVVGAPRLSALDPSAVSIPPLEEILAALDEKSAVLAASVAMVERSRAALDLARRSLKPDFMASASYLNRGPMPGMFTVDVGIVAPLYRGRKQKQAVAEAEARLLSAEAGREAMRLKARATAEKSLADFRASVLEARSYAQGVLAVDALAVESALAGFQAGKAPFITVLEAHNALYRDRWQHAELLFHVLWHGAALDAWMAGE